MAAMPLERGLDDPDEAVTYVDGECHFLALALHELLGLSPVYVAARTGDGRLAVGHVAVALPGGLVADAEGIWRPRDLLAHWRATDIVPTTPDEIRSDLADGGDLSEHCLDRIARARRLLERDERAYLARLREQAAASVPDRGTARSPRPPGRGAASGAPGSRAASP